MSIPVIDLEKPGPERFFDQINQGITGIFQKQEAEKKHKEGSRSLARAMGLPEDALESQTPAQQQLTIQGMQLREANIAKQRKAINDKYITAIKGLSTYDPDDIATRDRARETWQQELQGLADREQKTNASIKPTDSVSTIATKVADGDQDMLDIAADLKRSEAEQQQETEALPEDPTPVSKAAERFQVPKYLKSPKPEAKKENVNRENAFINRSNAVINARLNTKSTDLKQTASEIKGLVSTLEKKLVDAKYPKKVRERLLSKAMENARVPIMDMALKLNKNPDDPEAFEELRNFAFSTLGLDKSSLDDQETVDDFVEDFLKKQKVILKQFGRSPLIKDVLKARLDRLEKGIDTPKQPIGVPKTKASTEAATQSLINDILSIIGE